MNWVKIQVKVIFEKRDFTMKDYKLEFLINIIRVSEKQFINMQRSLRCLWKIVGDMKRKAL